MFTKCFIWKVWIKTLQVLFKVNKKSTFFVKKCYWEWKFQLRWNQRGCLEDILSFLKSPRTPKNVKNWARYTFHKFSIFEEVHKEKYLSKSKIFQIGLVFLGLNLFLILFGTFKPSATIFVFIFLFNLDFIHLKTN